MPADEDLRQADLSHLRVEDMTEAQRAELKRRYEDFVSRVVKPRSAARTPRAAVKSPVKWVPGGVKRRG